MSITMEDIEKRLSAVEQDTKKILFYLESDPSTNTKGFVETLQKTEERVRILELQRKIDDVRSGTIAGLISGIVVVVGFVVQAWVNQKFD